MKITLSFEHSILLINPPPPPKKRGEEREIRIYTHTEYELEHNFVCL